MCQCCAFPQVETIEHVFLESGAARAIWAHFVMWFPSTRAHTFAQHTVMHTLTAWRSSFPRAAPMHISFLIPCLILWFIWTERNSRKHRAISFRVSHVIWQVTHHLQLLVASKKLLPIHWAGCLPRMDFMPASGGMGRTLRSRMVRWVASDTPWVKLNTDGSFDMDLQMAAGGGLVRDHTASLLAAYCAPFVASSSFDAELQALAHGLQIARQFGDHIWVEMDAAAVIALISSGRHGPAQTRHTVARIRLLLCGVTVRFSHIHREGNRAADFLARRGLQSSEFVRFDAASVPRYLAALIRMDQLGYPNFRFRYG